MEDMRLILVAERIAAAIERLAALQEATLAKVTEAHPSETEDEQNEDHDLWTRDVVAREETVRLWRAHSHLHQQGIPHGAPHESPTHTH